MFEQYISELLYKYDTVIIPGFGAFILKYSAASINPSGNNLTPPSKLISFDPLLKNNDGILANHISEKEKISFFDACSKILAFVENTNISLDEGKQLIMQKIGTFSKTPYNTIIFTPDTSVNYNLESFGMGEIIAYPILREDLKIKPQKQSSKTRPIKERKSFSNAIILTLIIIIILSASITALFIIKPDFINSINLSWLIKASENKGNALICEQRKGLVKSEATNIKDAADTIKSDSTVTTSGSLNDSIQQPKKCFYIISATFRIKENAENYAVTLKQKGYDSKAIYLRDKGFFVVSYNSYNTQDNADQALTKIKSAGNPAAWICVYSDSINK